MTLHLFELRVKCVEVWFYEHQILIVNVVFIMIFEKIAVVMMEAEVSQVTLFINTWSNVGFKLHASSQTSKPIRTISVSTSIVMRTVLLFILKPPHVSNRNWGIINYFNLIKCKKICSNLPRYRWLRSLSVSVRPVREHLHCKRNNLPWQ